MMNETSKFKVFVYGTLLDKDIQKLVLNRDKAPKNLGVYSLKDYEVIYAKSEVYPILNLNPGQQAIGQVLEVTDVDLRRLDYYEGEGYNRVKSTVTSLHKDLVVYIYMPNKLLDMTSIPWSLEKFIEEHKDNFLIETKTYMDKI